MMVKILIADDHPIIASTLREMLSPDPGFHVLPPVSNSTELFKALETNSVDVLITDYCMPGGTFGDGLVMINRVRRKYPDVKIIVFTSIEQPAIIHALDNCGVLGVMTKSDDLREITVCVERCRRGMSYRGGRAEQILEEQMRRKPTARRPLSPKEMEVLRMYLDGQNVSQIAAALKRSAKTINNQKRMAMCKLGCRTDMELFKLHVSSPVQFDREGEAETATAA
ncbi:response regulator transcription factor [Pandoraea nosoerga]|uniref:DNA-binding response regulator n=1 Tax=Pandoraea nosoerga TaxID=2508296 RepID=A0A5E4SI73_9BURK|nr:MULTISPECIES: response regulator transcription factor [Pandoraea]MBN4665329.1 response regulator transcription factor [Pandoraea nosoerga]MBN4674729.1 response regulator transcription factor [Pandoraea nosoerga]MBN4680618.1 response regulator transcription factor [Pandoraea nosoerga]MBN4744023.1 response regulator transcription factor [Pandoraea nosoerga]VVD74472.1 DNA-binding response regulator [Pandoraea nosoerga]